MVLGIALSIFAISFGVLATDWIGPTQVPPGGNLPAPLHEGIKGQLKDGPLGIGGVLRAYSNFIVDGDVGIGTPDPGAKLDVVGTVRMTGFQLGTSATAGRVLTTNASGVGTWQAVPSAPVTSVFTRTGAITAAVGDYSSFYPTLTGGGASGTWGISITGNANTVGGLSVHTGRNNEANKIVRTQANGYLDVGWINTTSGDRGTTAPDRIYASSDAYLRYYTPANFATVMNTWLVRTSADQTIAGTKTFSSNVVVPVTPTANAHAASKLYVDQQVGAAGGDRLGVWTNDGNTRLGDFVSSPAPWTCVNTSYAPANGTVVNLNAAACASIPYRRVNYTHANCAGTAFRRQGEDWSQVRNPIWGVANVYKSSGESCCNQNSYRNEAGTCINESVYVGYWYPYVFDYSPLCAGGSCKIK